MKKSGWITGIFLSIAFFSLAQKGPVEDSVINLPPFEIVSERLDEHITGLKKTIPDSLLLTMSSLATMDKLLGRYTSLQIKSYNYNGLSTISFRGTAAEHTGIFWNGLLLNPSNNGLVDFSLIPAGFFNEVSILYGGGSSLFGSGNIGGSIHLNSIPAFGKNATVDLALHSGSFSELAGSTGATFAGENWYSKTQVVARTADNDFRYTGPDGGKAEQDHAATEQYGFMQDVYLRSGKNFLAGASFWLQENHRQIPPSLTQAASDATQDDRSLRGMMSIQNFFNNGSLEFKGGLFHDYFLYKDPSAAGSGGIESEIVTDRFTSELQYNRKIGHNLNIMTGVAFTRETGNSDNWNGDVAQNSAGLFAMIRYFIPAIHWMANLNLRQNLSEGYHTPFTPALGLEGKIWKALSGKVNLSGNYRIPTFNERFWIPGGNEDLDPESSLNAEAGLEYLLQAGELFKKVAFGATVFTSDVENRIIWVPEGSYSVPENISKVWSRGLELAAVTAINPGNWTLALEAGYTFVRSTNESRISQSDESLGKQLIYVPEQSLSSTLTILHRDFVLMYDHSITGKRYTTSDNSEFLPLYNIGNVSLAKDVHMRKHSFSVRFEVNNLWGEIYQAVAFYPMPGRYSGLSLKYKFWVK